MSYSHKPGFACVGADVLLDEKQAEIEKLKKQLEDHIRIDQHACCEKRNKLRKKLEDIWPLLSPESKRPEGNA